MARQTRLACLLALLTVSSADKDQTRWSRQISSYTSDISDWVPLPGPVERDPPQPQIKRQAIAEPRILSEPVFPGFGRPSGFSQESFPSRAYFNAPANRQLYLQSVPAVPSAPQNYLTDQGFGQNNQGFGQSNLGFGQNIRFGLSQPNFPPNQGFISQQFPFEGIPQIKARPQHSVPNPIKFENFAKTNLHLSPQAKPFNSQLPKLGEAPKFVDGYRVENISSDFAVIPKKKPQSLQKIKFESFDKVPKTEMIPPKPKSEREEVQLLYVPLESLNRGQFNFRSPLTTSQIGNSDSHSQILQGPRPLEQPLDSFGTDRDFFTNFNTQYKYLDQVPKFSTIPTQHQTTPSTTPKPKKLKPHQPPLAIFMAQESKSGNQVRVGDVLSLLKNVETVPVLDSVNPLSAPSVFIGPSSLNPPDNFVKFELPYLSNIEHSDKKLRQLPFFVAPLSYSTPQGFAKIPFPSPHVGSVVINSQIKGTVTTITPSTPYADVIPNSYSTPSPSYRQETKPATQKPSISYYSTIPPKTNAPANYQSNYYSFEPQTVSTVKPTPHSQDNVANSPKAGSYFLSNVGGQFNPTNVDFQTQNEFKVPQPIRGFNIPKQTETPTTPRTTVTSTSAKPSTYPSQLLETHNPYSINQAFHFSTPTDYHSFFDESYAAPGSNQPLSSPIPSSPSPSSTLKSTETVTDRQNYQSSPNYLQNYSPEIHYESEIQNSRYNAYNTNEAKKSEVTSNYNPSLSTISSPNPQTDYNADIVAQTHGQNGNTQIVDKVPPVSYETDTPSTKSPHLYNQYETNNEFENQTSSTTSTTTTTTTTRRTPLRPKGRPRYTTPRIDSTNESTTRTVVTRRPIRERRPLPMRPKYEPNKITTERATRKPVDSNENTTKYSRMRTRGRVHYRPTESDEFHNKPSKGRNTKEEDLAYQRDVLHQNYPVTLMERASTVDIEAITEPSPKISSTKNVDATKYYDTENAYSNDRASISQHAPNTASKEEIQTYTSKTEAQTEGSYASKIQSTHGDEYTYQSRSSSAPVEALSSFGETSVEKEDDNYEKQTTPILTPEKPEVISYATESSRAVTEQTLPNYSINNEFSAAAHEEVTTTPDIEIAKVTSQEDSRDVEPEQNVVQTTPSYNRVRVRPGVIRQYHQASSTESSKTKTDRRRPAQAVTYRPFDRRRTTMRIDEIEADLKTKQVHARPEVQDYRHPVYKPESSTEPAVSSQSLQETTTKRGVIRRRRPTYTTTTTDAPSSKRVNEAKSRFRVRRPTEKPVEKPEVQTDATTSTVRNTLHSRYSNRPRLSERYNRKPESDDSEDQDSNSSIHRPKYIEPESEQWSPKVSTDSFKPYNPNDIADDKKDIATERTSDNEDELDIITAKNEYDDILISVTPATNNRVTKKIPDIPPTLEALVEQSKITKSDSGDNMSTFESMLEEVMKSLEEQDENEYSTTNVMKHKGGEIGEIPPERIISSGENYAQKATIVDQQEITTVEPEAEDSAHTEASSPRGRRRGFWKKVKVRPITESIETAESQYYPNSANRIGNTITLSKAVYDKSGRYDKLKPTLTTYRPNYQFIKEKFNNDNESLNVLPIVDIPKIKKNVENKAEEIEEQITTETSLDKETPSESNPGEMDLGTGAPDPTSIDNMYHSTPTEPTPTESGLAFLDKTDDFNIMNYLFGATADEDENPEQKFIKEVSEGKLNATENIKKADIEITTEQVKSKETTSETSFIPEEITTVATEDEFMQGLVTEFDIKKVNGTEKPRLEERSTETTEKSLKVETSSTSNFMDATHVVSTSMSTEISHETEICFRGKCIKTSDDML